MYLQKSSWNKGNSCNSDQSATLSTFLSFTQEIFLECLYVSCYVLNAGDAIKHKWSLPSRNLKISLKMFQILETCHAASHSKNLTLLELSFLISIMQRLEVIIYTVSSKYTILSGHQQIPGALLPHSNFLKYLPSFEFFSSFLSWIAFLFLWMLFFSLLCWLVFSISHKMLVLIRSHSWPYLPLRPTFLWWDNWY